jgi:uncharacterized membrane protein YqhA
MKLLGSRRSNWTAFAFELAIYTVLVLAYFGFVLHFLAGWLKEIFDHDLQSYAVVCLLLMIGQAVGLEMISGLLFGLIRRGKHKK